MKTACTTIFFLALFTCSAYAQEATLKGKVTDKAGIAVPSATVSILKASDSSWLRSEVAGDDGRFTIANIATGNYLVDVSAVGFDNVKQAVTLKAGMNDNVVVTIQKKSNALNEVTVTGKKSFIENGLGKTIINVEGSGVATGSNVLDMLRNLPGIHVDANNNISMSGKQGVLVLINGKETYLSAEQLADYLKGMSANEVSQMELISQPSAKYEASGNAGIINIKMKKIRKEGLNGSADLEGALAMYPSIFANTRLNYHKNKLNLSANASYLDAIGWIRINRERNFLDPQSGDVVGYNNSLMESKEHFWDAKLQLAADYDLDSNTTIGLSGIAVYHPNQQSTWTYATIADNASNNIVYNYAVTGNRFLRTNDIVNGYLKHEFSKESSLDVNLDYVNYGQHTYQDTKNTNRDGQNNVLPGLEIRGDLPFTMDVYSGKADYVTKPGKVKIEAGVKSSLVTIDNNAGYDILENNTWIPDTLRSNRFLYNENINAAYVNGSMELGKKWQVQAGLRAEQMNRNGKQEIGAKEFINSSIALFPTGFVSYKADDNNQLELNYGRRIERPNYRSLNPFIYFINQYSYSVGNPELRPEYSNNLELKHSYKNMLTTTVSCSHTNDVINTVVIPDANTKGTYSTNKNVGVNQSASLHVGYNKQLYKWLLLALASDAWFSEYYGKLLDEEVHVTGGGFYASIDTQFVFGKWTGELYYDFASAGRQDLLVNARSRQYFAAYVSRKLFNDTCTIKLHMRDPFGMFRGREYSTFDNTTSTVDYKYQMQQVALSVNYNFGKNNNSAKHNSELDEMKRMN